MLQPVVRRTWSPKGCTPIHYSWDRHDRLSAISAISVSPARRRLGLFFTIRKSNIRSADFARFAAPLLEHFPRGIILVLDRWMVHRSAAKKLEKRFPRRISVEWLPPYAPELNPVEQVWNRAKYTDLANYIPNDVVCLNSAVRRSLKRTGKKQNLLRSAFKYSKLRL